MQKATFYFLLFSFSACGQPRADWEREMIEVVQEPNKHMVISAEKLIDEGWHDLAQPQFWKKIMCLSPDSCIINIASSRTVIGQMSNKDWESMSQLQKDLYRDSVRQLYNLAPDARIFVTSGKSDFYRFDAVYPTIEKGITAFDKNNVDPWYAQAILLIESPGQLKKSKAGAYGAFQLMPGVARNMGLTVNNYVDERANFDRSAYAASQLIKKICIPEAKKILDAHQLKYKESDTWFRLFVLHVYHAGALNVAAAVNKISPSVGDLTLIQSMWQTSAGNFGNNSQNYTQLALASQLILHERIHQKCDYILTCYEFE